MVRKKTAYRKHDNADFDPVYYTAQKLISIPFAVPLSDL